MKSEWNKKKISGRTGLNLAVLIAVLAAVSVGVHESSLSRSALFGFTESGMARAETATDSASSVNAFLKAYPVFQDPRCVNCHPKGDHPLQGDNSRPHAMNVKRGQGGIGENGLLCGTCHQDRSLPGTHMPPAAPGWQLPPREMPMVFENQSPEELCAHFTNPAMNGGRSPAEVVEHLQEAPLVLWGWDPGEGRTPVHMPHQEFVQYMTEWARKGAVCPE